MPAVGLGRGAAHVVRGSSGAGPVIENYISLAKIAQNVRADLGITLNATRVSAWGDRMAGAKHYAQATAGNQPLYSATGGNNGLGHVQLDDASRYLQSALTLAAPGTQPVLIWMIVRQESWTSHNRIVTDTGQLSLNVQQSSTTPGLRTYNGAFGTTNNASTIGTWWRVAAYMSNSTADFIKVGAANITGYNAGNNASASNRLIGSAAGLSAHCSIAEIATLLPVDLADALAMVTALDTYATDWHGL